MLKFISLGSGSSGNCYYLYTPTDGLLIDAGVGLRTLKKHLVQYGLSLARVHHILITHDHADHVKAVGCLSDDYQLPVYATEKVHEGIQRNYCVSRKIEPRYVHTIEKNVPIELGDFRVTPFDVPHDSADCCGFQVEAEGVRFCIITDAGELTSEMKPFVEQANYLVIEANHDEQMLQAGPYPQYLKTRIRSGHGHLSNHQCAQVLVEAATPALRHVWLCHLSEENNHPELARKTIETELAAAGIVAGADFKLDVLKRRLPTGIFELTP